MVSPYCSEIEIENVIASLQLVFNPFPRSIEARIFLTGSPHTKHKFIYLAEPNGEDGKHSSVTMSVALQPNEILRVFSPRILIVTERKFLFSFQIHQRTNSYANILSGE